jgi:CubicO group peptidase (beta-lactamase class C family)
MKFMRGILALIFGILISANTVAQSRQFQKTDSVFRLIKRYSITKDADAIYELAAPDFKQFISQGNFRDFLFRDLFSLGTIHKDSLISFVNNVTATYKLQMDAVNMQLAIGLAEGDKLDYFKLEPYKDVSLNKPSPVNTSNPLQSITDKMVDSVARKYIQLSNTVGLSIGVFKAGKTNIYNYGQIKKGNNQLPAVNTIFEIGSITKTFTAAVLAWYVNEGKLKLSDPITRYLPDSVARNPSLMGITLVNLINHTSGLPRMPDNFTVQQSYEELNPYKHYTKELLFSYLKTCTLKSAPGTKYAYSNLGVGLLGVILEKISGKSYEQLVLDIICEPLGMKSTLQRLSSSMNTRFATVYNEDGNQTPAWDFDVLASGGALRSDMGDLLTYVNSNMANTGSKLSKAFDLTHQVTFDNDTKLGLGWHIIKVDGISYYFHNGGTGGSSSFLAYNVEKNIAVIILSNAAASTDATGVSILKRLQ